MESEDKDGRHTRPHADWKLDKHGGSVYLLDNYNAIRDSVAYPEMTSGISWGIVDGGYWKFFSTPTPEKPNTEAKAYDEVVPAADMSGLKSGFYNEAFTLNPPALEDGVKLRCTTNGSVPTESSPEFNSPKRIDHSIAFRCATFKKDAISSKVTTRTFFVDEESVKMPIVAISVDSSFFQKHYIKTSCEAPKGCSDSAGMTCLRRGLRLRHALLRLGMIFRFRSKSVHCFMTNLRRRLRIMPRIAVRIGTGFAVDREKDE